MVALERGIISPKAYNAAVLGLAARRHGHVPLDADMLSDYVAADDERLDRMTIASRYIAGDNADMNSHISVVLKFFGKLWIGPCPGLKAMRATSLLIDRLVRARPTLRLQILVVLWMNTNRELRAFIEGWAAGHLIARKTLVDAAQGPAKGL